MEQPDIEQNLIQRNDPTLYPPLFIHNKKTCCQCFTLLLFLAVIMVISVFFQTLPMVIVDSSYSY